MKIDKEQEIEKRGVEASEPAPGHSCDGKIDRDVSCKPYKEAIILDIEKAIGPENHIYR